MALRYDAANRITIARSCHLHARERADGRRWTAQRGGASPFPFSAVNYVWCPPIPCCQLRMVSPDPLLSITYGAPRSPAVNYVWCPPIRKVSADPLSPDPCCQLRMVSPRSCCQLRMVSPDPSAVNYVWCPPIPAVNYVWCPPIKTVNCVWCPPIHVPRSTYGVPRSRQIAADIPLLLDLVVQNRVGDRPDRYEPRAVRPAGAAPASRDNTSRCEEADRARRDNI